MNGEIKHSAIEPLFEPWEEPIFHRVRGNKKGGSSKVVEGRRPSPIKIVQNLRQAVALWRDSFYVGASETTRALFNYWFQREHRLITQEGEEIPFRYFFCQREAIETFVYLYEIRKINRLSRIIEEFGGFESYTSALGITAEEDAWARYALKVATGAGKTKIMSLAAVWSYFHALRESESDMSKHFVLIAPNLTVYERLREDFGDGKIFENDPLIPPEWRGDWNMSIVLQDEASSVSSGGVLYLTNIHRLYEKKKQKKKEAETYSFVGPTVTKTKVYDTGKALRDRITSHPNFMVLNDEAHHVWDPDSAWNEAITFLHETSLKKGGKGISAQLDLSATPKDNKGQLFKHIVCDTPLGEAVDGGIVKTPIIGKGDSSLSEEPSDNAAFKYDRHIRLGYERWKRSKEEWEKSGKKALLFIMCGDTKEADEIVTRLNTEETFKELNGKTINLHTNLKGKMKKRGRGKEVRLEFVESDKEISDDDLKALRKLSRELDRNTSPYYCIVSVLMLREGWDVRNVTTIVPLRPYSSKANILPEQTLGRGLRRITPPGKAGAHEMVTVVEHPAFASLYQQELAQEGLFIEVVDADKVQKTTVTIYPDFERKDIKKLDISVPRLTSGYRTLSTIKGLESQDVEREAKKYPKLPLNTKTDHIINYEGRHLFTDEVVERIKIDLPLLATGFGAVSYYIKQLETICKIRGIHQQIAPLLEEYITSQLFNERTSLAEDRCVSRLGDSDAGEYIRAVFVPLIRSKIIKEQQRIQVNEFFPLSQTKPFQVTFSEKHPAENGKKTLFNLVPCNRELEVTFKDFMDKAPDVKSFAKNAGPQALRIDYLAVSKNLAFYTPDFYAVDKNNIYYLIETKGQVDRDVPRKAKAALSWCKAASESGVPWKYMYVQQDVFQRERGNTLDGLYRSSMPSLENLLRTEEMKNQFPLFENLSAPEEKPDIFIFAAEDEIQYLPNRYRMAVEQASILYQFMKEKENMNYAPAFISMMGVIDDACTRIIKQRLHNMIPVTVEEQKTWFSPLLDFIGDKGARKHFEDMAYNLKRTLIFNNGLSPTGLLRSCLEYALQNEYDLGGVFTAVKEGFSFQGNKDMLNLIESVNEFRNEYVAHQNKELTDTKTAHRELQHWVQALIIMTKSIKVAVVK